MPPNVARPISGHSVYRLFYQTHERKLRTETPSSTRSGTVPLVGYGCAPNSNHHDVYPSADAPANEISPVIRLCPSQCVPRVLGEQRAARHRRARAKFAIITDKERAGREGDKLQSYVRVGRGTSGCRKCRGSAAVRRIEHIIESIAERVVWQIIQRHQTTHSKGANAYLAPVRKRRQAHDEKRSIYCSNGGDHGGDH